MSHTALITILIFGSALLLSQIHPISIVFADPSQTGYVQYANYFNLLVLRIC